MCSRYSIFLFDKVSLNGMLPFSRARTRISCWFPRATSASYLRYVGVALHYRSRAENSFQMLEGGPKFTETLAEVDLELIIDPAATETGLKCEQCAEIETE